MQNGFTTRESIMSKEIYTVHFRVLTNILPELRRGWSFSQHGEARKHSAKAACLSQR